jgi:glycine/serine hydroxymethyltransferase
VNFEQLKNLVAQGECETLAFKATTGQFVEGGKTLCGFLNNKGGALRALMTGDTFFDEHLMVLDLNDVILDDPS